MTTTPITVRAKFQVDAITTRQGGYKEIKLRAVCSSTGENKDFADATPTGEMTMSISPNRPAGDVFKPGDQFYLDFTKAG